MSNLSSLLERKLQREKIETKGNECYLGALVNFLSRISVYVILTFYSSIEHLLEKGSFGTSNAAHISSNVVWPLAVGLGHRWSLLHRASLSFASIVYAL